MFPFCLESKLGGVQRLLKPDESLWYRRTFTGKPVDGMRTLLNFEAVDYCCEVFVNGLLVGEHVGGNTPFSLDVTRAIAAGENELVVRVEDDTEAFQLRGKQTLNARGIWYTQVSGIWQTVWLETVGASRLMELNIQTDVHPVTDAAAIVVSPEISGPEISGPEASDTENSGADRVVGVRVEVKEGDRTIAKSEGAAGDIRVEIADAKLWSPSNPHLYDLVVSLLDSSGNVVDQVRSYTGIRSVGNSPWTGWTASQSHWSRGGNDDEGW